jgi:hypothetical protein
MIIWKGGRATGDHLERWQGDRRVFEKKAGRQESIWKGGRETGDHLVWRQWRVRRGKEAR